jgi:cobalamin 5'-phosphate synthase/cobalamin synthase
VVKAARALAAAISFLTILPIGRRVELDGADVARGSVLFPLVGGAIGALSGGVVWALGDQLPALLAAAIGVAAGAAVTGALHLDGLADCADGFGGRTPEDRLRIMRDHTIGTYGATALLLDLLVRVSALAALAGTKEALLVAAAAGGIGRAGGPLLAAALPYAQTRPGAGEALSAHPSTARAVAATLVGVAVAVACVGIDAWAVLLVTAVVVPLAGRSARNRLGGVTGDVMGATAELVEIGSLALLVALQ